jgi:hypothetical protein
MAFEDAASCKPGALRAFRRPRDTPSQVLDAADAPTMVARSGRGANRLDSVLGF